MGAGSFKSIRLTRSLSGLSVFCLSSFPPLNPHTIKENLRMRGIKGCNIVQNINAQYFDLFIVIESVWVDWLFMFSFMTSMHSYPRVFRGNDFVGCVDKKGYVPFFHAIWLVLHARGSRGGATFSLFWKCLNVVESVPVFALYMGGEPTKSQSLPSLDFVE